MSQRDTDRNPPPRNTPRSEDPARLNDLNAERTPDDIAQETGDAATQETQEGNPESTERPGAGSDRGTRQAARRALGDRPTNPPHPQNDGQLWAQDTDRGGDPSFVASGVSDGGKEGKYGEDSYKDRRNEKPASAPEGEAKETRRKEG
jgi:hypothetical protein